MINENLIKENYLYHDYERSFKKNHYKNELLSFLYDKLSKISTYIDKFIKDKMENKILKDNLTTYTGDNYFINLYLLIQKTIDTTFNENYKMINTILNYIIELKELYNPYFKKYDEFLISQKKFASKILELENSKSNFYEASKKAELFTYQFLNKKVFNLKIKNQNEFKEKEELKNLAKIELDKYKLKIIEANEELKLFNDNQKKLFKVEKELLIKYNSIYSDSLMTYYEHQMKINQLANDIKETIVNLNIKNNKKELNDYLNNYKQIEKIEFKQYKSHIQFDNCENAIQLSACFMAYNEMAHVIGKYKDIELLNEAQKLEISKEIDRILHLDKKITEEDENKLKEIIKNEMGQNIFINLFSTLRSTGLYEKSEKFIISMGKMLNIILKYAEKENNFEKVKNCIILSQTFYYFDLNKEKKYIFGFIKDNNWLKGEKFWRTFIDVTLNTEFKKLSNFKNQNKNEVLLTQLLPFVNNMKEFGIDYCIIIKIIDEILEKYKYLNKESYNTLFSLISSDNEEIEKYRKKYKENLDLEKELYNNEEKKNNEKNDNLKETEINQNEIKIDEKNEFEKQDINKIKNIEIEEKNDLGKINKEEINEKVMKENK